MHRRLLLERAAIALAVLLGASGLAGRGDRGDPLGAELVLAEAITELEEIVGRELLDEEPPALPVVTLPELPAEDWKRVGELAEEPARGWSAEEHLALGAIVLRSAPALARLATAGGERPGSEDLTAVGLSLLRLLRLQAVADRLAFLGGDQTAFLDGWRLRSELAFRLERQAGIVAPLIANAVRRELLLDLQLAVGDGATSPVTLEALWSLLDDWRQMPDPAAVIAREGLWTLRRSDQLRAELPRELGGAVPDAIDTALLAPLARATAQLARGCRSVGCAAAVSQLRRQLAGESPDDEALVGMLLPNYLDGVRKLAELGELIEVGRAAVALRVESAERGGYPARLDELPATLSVARGEIGGLRYDRSGAGVRLALDRPDALEAASEGSRRRLQRLLVWDLPEPTLPPPCDG